MPENRELEKQIIALKSLIEKQANKSNDIELTLDKTNKITKWVQSVIALAIVIIGVGISWGISQTKISVLEHDVANYKTHTTDKMIKIEENIHELQLKQAGDDQLLQTMQRDITEIKENVQKIIERRP
jgi:hypothetical protein